MPLGRGKTRTPPARAMAASAARLKVDKRVTTGRAIPKPAGWQERAFRYYDDVPEVGDGVNFHANACSRIRFYAAVLDEQGQPRPVSEDEDGPALYAAAVATMQLLGEGPAQAAVVAPLAVNLHLAGEAYLQGCVDPDTGTESIRVRSVSEVDDIDGRIAVRDEPGATPKALDAELNPTMDRVWRPHPQFASRPNSPMTRLLGVCEELLLLSQAERAGDRSRLARSGLALFDSSIEIPPTSPEDQRGTAERLMDMVYNAATAAISEEGSASAALPIFAECSPRGDQAVKDMIFHQTFDRPADATTLDRRDRLIRRIGYGLEVPPDVITGMKDVKYTNAIQIDKNTFRHYVEPFAIVMADAFTVAVLRPGLVADDIDADVARGVFVWYDPTELVTEPDQAEPASKVFDAGELSGAALRRLHGISDDDAPTPVERALRLAKDLHVTPEVAQTLIAAVAAGTLDPATDLPGVVVALPVATSSTAGDAATTIDGETVTAAAVAGRISTRALVELDRDVRSRLHTECEVAVASALRRAAANLAGAAQKDTAARSIAATAARGQLAATLGPAVCASLVAPQQVAGLTAPTTAVLAAVAADELLRGALDDLRGRAARLLDAAQQQAADLAIGLAGARAIRPAVGQLEQWMTQALEYLTASLTALLGARLFDPSDAPSTVPLGVARATVGYAAGLPEGHGGYRLDGLPVTIGDGGVGLATGRITADTFRSGGAELVEYEWDYGITSIGVRFEPHYELNGLRFTSFTDEALANRDSFPGEPFYVPGDHAGCACDAIPIYDATGGMSGTGDEPNYGADQPVYAEPLAASGGAS